MSSLVKINGIKNSHLYEIIFYFFFEKITWSYYDENKLSDYYFISEENELYFASDGRPGLGGLDIFVSKIKADSSFDRVQNIGEPINTKSDDFAFIIDSKIRKGSFSSNKEGGKGNDDIYKFTETRRLDCKKKISGIVIDPQTNAVLGDAKVILLDDKYQVMDMAKVN